MSDRLRQLDALFAEKVLGLSERGCSCSDAEGGYDSETGRCTRCSMFRAIGYTRSLDAAWAGIGKAGRFATIETGSEIHSCTFPGTDTLPPFVGLAMHPAEAVVLACLRAVGVTEEELGALG